MPYFAFELISKAAILLIFNGGKGPSIKYVRRQEGGRGQAKEYEKVRGRGGGLAKKYVRFCDLHYFQQQSR